MNIREFINIIESASRELTDSTLEKKVIRVYNPIDKYDIGCIVNYIIDLNKYEVYMFAGKTKDKIISNVGTKVYDDEKSSIEYFEKLSNYIENKDFDSLVEMIDNK